MANLTVNYLGLELRNPIIVSSSPFTSSVDKIERIAEHGAGAVVLKSVFEEQINGETSFLERFNDYPEAADYLHGYISDDYLMSHLDVIYQSKKLVNIPIIASINCTGSGRWIEYAKKIEQAGADALELNIYILPTNAKESSAEIEQKYLDIVATVTSTISIPVSVKLGVRFTNVLSVAREIYNRNGRGVVLYNRFFEPDIDIKNMTVTSSETISLPGELRNSLRSTALCTAEVPQIDISVSTGVHTGEDVIKSLLVGAKTVQVCSALYIHGINVIADMQKFVGNWMDTNSYATIDEFRAKLSAKDESRSELFQRAQYMRYFPRE